MEFNLFISYSRKDTDRVCKFVDRLKKEGFSVWFDTEGVRGGDEYKIKIRKAILNSDILLFFSSKYSKVSKWTPKEIGTAINKNKPIIPIKLDNSEYSDDAQFDLVNLNYIDSSNSQHDCFEDLIEAVYERLSEIDPNWEEIRAKKRTLEELNKVLTENKEQVRAICSQLKKLNANIQPNIDVEYSNGSFESESVRPNKNRLWFYVCITLISAVVGGLIAIYVFKNRGAEEVFENERILHLLKDAQNLSEEGRCLEAFECYKEAANDGSAEGAWNVGYYYYSGKVDCDNRLEEARKWYERAAEMGYPSAFNSLGNIYYDRSKQTKDPEDMQNAVMWYEKGAHAGNKYSQYSLGQRYLLGEAVGKDTIEAIKWFGISAGQGYESALEEIRKLLKKTR